VQGRSAEVEYHFNFRVHIREAGSTAIQEVRLRWRMELPTCAPRLDAGLAVMICPRNFSFFFNAHSDLLEEISKFRAARRIVGTEHERKICRERSASLTLRFHAQQRDRRLRRSSRETILCAWEYKHWRGAGRLPVLAHKLIG